MKRRNTFSLLVLFIFSIGLTSCNQEAFVIKKNDPTRPHSQNEDYGNYYNHKVSTFMISPNFTNEIIFLGDSITDSADWHELFPGKTVINRGISGDVISGVLNRLDEVTESQPKKVFIMIGTNDLAWGHSPEKILQEFQVLVQRMKTQSPKTTIYIQSILPTFQDEKRNNEDINAINEGLMRLAKEHNLTYIDLHSLMKTEENELREDLSYDGLHLNGKAYIIWKNAIAPYVNE